MLKALVVVTIAFVAYWASTGGFEAIEVPGTVPEVSTTLVGTPTTAEPPTTSLPSTTTLPPATTSLPPGSTTAAG